VSLYLYPSVSVSVWDGLQVARFKIVNHVVYCSLKICRSPISLFLYLKRVYFSVFFQGSGAVRQLHRLFRGITQNAEKNLGKDRDARNVPRMRCAGMSAVFVCDLSQPFSWALLEFSFSLLFFCFKGAL